MNLSKEQKKYILSLLRKEQDLYAYTLETENYDAVTEVINELEDEAPQFDYIKFVKSRIEAQQEYDEAAGRPGPKDEVLESTRYAKVIEYIGHMMEECTEARVLVPRRSWKTSEPGFLDSQELLDAFCAEMYDILLLHAATLVYAGVDPHHFAKIVDQKNDYNSKRTDHQKNLPEAIKELHGDCDSSWMLDEEDGMLELPDCDGLEEICEHPDEELTGSSLKEVIKEDND